MNENQPVEHRELGNVRAHIRTITTPYGQMRTVALQRAWSGRDGETRYANDLRESDVRDVIFLLAYGVRARAVACGQTAGATFSPTAQSPRNRARCAPCVPHFDRDRNTFCPSGA